MLQLRPQASACGKVILVGEHAVVYGHPALAAGIGTLSLFAEPLTDRNAFIELSIPAWDLDLRLRPDDDHPVGRAALEVLTHCDGPVTGWSIRGETTLPSRAGLGSSAALTVALSRLVLGPDAAPDDVVEASLAGERVFHGEPSGLDSAVATYGGVVRFVRGGRPEPVVLAAPVPLWVIPSGIPRSTADQVATVRRMWETYPRITRPILDVLGVCTAEAAQALRTADHVALATVMRMAHELLSAVGVSTPALDELCALALRHGARGAKLTGAGGGGSIVALAPTDPQPLGAVLRDRGITPVVMNVGGERSP